MDKILEFIPFLSMAVKHGNGGKGSLQTLLVRLMEVAIIAGLLAYAMETRIDAIGKQIEDVKEQIEKLDVRVYELGR